MEHEKDPTFIDLLEQLENYSWAQPNGEAGVGDGDGDEVGWSGPRSLMSLGGNASGLLGANELNQGKARLMRDPTSGAQRKLVRMTSSPSIRTNRANIGPPEDLPPQVRAKYARLIETINTSTAKAATFSQRPETSVVATRSASRGAAPKALVELPGNNKRQHLVVERPSCLFGALRREGGRRNSEEPMSLPHSVNYGFSPGTEESAGWQSALANEETPVKRISAPESGDGDADGRTDVEEDFFDITSLLSITVLSDIKTIRQEPQNFARHPSSLTPKSASQRSARSHECGTKMPARSRTALDFKYNANGHSQVERHKFGHEASGQVGGSHASSNYDYHPVSAYDSMPYHWMHTTSNPYANQEMAPEMTLKKSAERKPVDESTASVIEAFKAQVLARAKAPPQPPSAKSTREEESSGSSQGGATLDELEKSKPEEVSEKSEIDAADSTSGKSSICGVRTSPNATIEEEHLGTSTRKKGRVLEEASEDTVVGVEVGKLARRSAAGACERSSLRAVGLQTSSIPRLVSLHRSKFGLGQSTSQLDCRTPASSNCLAGGERTNCSDSKSNSRAGIKVGSKFVSQYKELRGKSLADEVGELAE